jgi:hypothetical protein
MKRAVRHRTITIAGYVDMVDMDIIDASALRPRMYR